MACMWTSSVITNTHQLATGRLTPRKCAGLTHGYTARVSPSQEPEALSPGSPLLIAKYLV